MNVLSRDRTWRFPARMLGDQVAFAGLLWLGFLIVAAGIAIGIAIFGEVTSSVMEVAVEAIRWFVAFIGVYVATTLLPLHVTHGKTRRDFAIEAAIFMVLYTAALALMAALSFLVERVLYAVGDWPHKLNDKQEHLYDSPRELPLIFTEFWLVFLIWIAAGALISVGFYRDGGTGVFAILLALIPLAMGEMAARSAWGPINAAIDLIGDPGTPPVWAAILLCLGAFALALAMIWPIVRDVPIKSRKA